MSDQQETLLEKNQRAARLRRAGQALGYLEEAKAMIQLISPTSKAELHAGDTIGLALLLALCEAEHNRTTFTKGTSPGGRPFVAI